MGLNDFSNALRRSCELAFAVRDLTPSPPWRRPQSGTRRPHPYPVTSLAESGRATGQSIRIPTPDACQDHPNRPPPGRAGPASP